LKIYYIIALITLIATLTAILIGNTQYNYLKFHQLKPFFYLLILSLLSDQICLFLIHLSITTKWVTSFYTLFEFNIILFSIGSWMGLPTFSNFIRYLSAAYFLFWGYEIFFQKSELGCDLADVIESMIFIIILPRYLLKLSNELSESIVKSPKFWVASALLIYFSSTIVIVGTQAILTSSGVSLQNYTWSIHNVIHIFITLLFIKAFLCIKAIPNYSS
jgi:hypothetical protein